MRKFSEQIKQEEFFNDYVFAGNYCYSNWHFLCHERVRLSYWNDNFRDYLLIMVLYFGWETWPFGNLVKGEI